MAVSSKTNGLFSRIKPFLPLQFVLKKLKHSLGDNNNPGGDQIYEQVGSDSVTKPGQMDMSKWRKLDSRTLGIAQKSISESSWIVLKILQSAGFEAYLVGGCVRDLLLNKVPKDFDIITTAALKQIKKEFHRCFIVGSRFPICRVHVKGSVIEVSSFDTVAKHDKEKELVTKIPHGCDKKDFVRWNNSMHRDFTVNSLFFNPFEKKIYDYANGMMDLTSLKLRTLIPAHQSFKEDNARILRGLRLAARLGLSLSKETEVAIRRLIPTIASLPKSRIMMEMNYMLSYGASGPSLSLLQQFKLLEMLLPLHASYLGQQAQNNQSSVMLMELFYNLDKLITCDHPSDCNLWVGLLAFHLALVINPQDALVLWTFASVLYHGHWNEGVKFGRERAHRPTVYIPEVTEAHYSMSNNELAEKVTQLASAVQYCIGGLSEPDRLAKLMTRFPDSPCPGLIFVPNRTCKRASDLFNVLARDVESYEKGRKCFNIDFNLLGKGDLCETRFVLGKIILDTMTGGAVQGSGDAEERPEPVESDSGKKIKVLGNENRKRGLPSNTTEPQKSAKKKKIILENSNDAEGGSTLKGNTVVNTESDKEAIPNLKMFEKDKEAILRMLKTVKVDKHPEIKNEEPRGRLETKLKSVKNEKKVILLETKTKGPREGTETKLKSVKNVILSENKTKEPREGKGPETKLKSVKNEKKVILLESKTKGPREGPETKLKSVKNVILSETKTKEPREGKGPETKLKSVKTKARKIIHSDGKSSLALDRNNRGEKVSESNGGVEGKNEEINEEAKGEKYKLPSLSSLFRR